MHTFHPWQIFYTVAKVRDRAAVFFLRSLRTRRGVQLRKTDREPFQMIACDREKYATAPLTKMCTVQPVTKAPDNGPSVLGSVGVFSAVLDGVL